MVLGKVIGTLVASKKEPTLEGVKLLVKEHRREVPEAKTTNYITMLKHKAAAADEGAFDLLYHEGGRVSEAATASARSDGTRLASRAF